MHWPTNTELKRTPRPHQQFVEGNKWKQQLLATCWSCCPNCVRVSSVNLLLVWTGLNMYVVHPCRPLRVNPSDYSPNAKRVALCTLHIIQREGGYANLAAPSLIFSRVVNHAGGSGSPWCSDCPQTLLARLTSASFARSSW